MELYEKSLRVLELPVVLNMLQTESVSPPAKEAAGKLRPLTDVHEIQHSLEETSAAKHLMSVKGTPEFSGVRDVSVYVNRAELGGMLNTRELLEIAGLLRAARVVRAYLTGEGRDETVIDHLFTALRGNKFLEDKIKNAILAEDEIADTASNELHTIRRHIRAANQSIRNSLQKIISSPSYAKALQEPIITQRGDRFVVPVKAECKGVIAGLIHDISASGSTLFIEPTSVVQAGNEIRELMAREKQEIERILMELSAEAAGFQEGIFCDFSLLVRLDCIFARAKLSYALNATEPEINESGKIKLVKARHPLLPQKSAVPIDIVLGEDYDTLIITGPNTGGKTVSLKTLGLFSLMAQCGLHIPVSDGSMVPVFETVLADIGDEQSIQQSLSTFSSHMKNIVGILEECSAKSLLLFDELGAGTDPVEGAALAIAIIEYARKMGSKIAATTHYAELKLYATTTPGVQNASCEFDVETLRPTYRLRIGLPGKSNAFAISQRLGLSDHIIAEAKSRMDTKSTSFEDVLAELDQKRQQMEQERLEESRKRAATFEDAKRVEDLRAQLEKERKKFTEQARREAAEIIAETRRKSDEILEELNALYERQTREAHPQAINEARADIRHKLNRAEEGLTDSKKPAIHQSPPKRRICPGDTVELLSIGTKAEVISVNEEGGLTLQAGILKITAKAEEVRLLENGHKESVKKIETPGQRRSFSPESFSVELDIRGMLADEGVAVMERYIDTAMLRKLNTVTIIHGKGTGALRQAVHQNLKKNRQVKSFRLGRFGEGETGVTIVELK